MKLIQAKNVRIATTVRLRAFQSHVISKHLISGISSDDFELFLSQDLATVLGIVETQGSSIAGNSPIAGYRLKLNALMKFYLTVKWKRPQKTN